MKKLIQRVLKLRAVTRAIGAKREFHVSNSTRNQAFSNFINCSCFKDTSVTFVTEDRRRKRFGLKTFAFIRRSRNVYIHCAVFMCRKGSTESKCTSECNRNVLRRAKRDAPKANKEQRRSYTKYYLVNIGPIERSFREELDRQNGKYQLSITSCNFLRMDQDFG